MSLRPRGPVNDVAVRDAALSVLSVKGWEHLHARAVAREIGRSARTVANRATDRTSLARLVLAARIAPAVIERWGDIDAAMRRTPDAGALARFLSRSVSWQDSPEGAGFAELVVVSNFEPEVARELRATVGAAMTASLDACAAATQRAQIAWAAALFVGAPLAGRLPRAAQLGDDEAFRSLTSALIAPDAPRDLPLAPATHMDIEPTLDPDPLHDVVLNTTLLLLGTRGYERMTVRDVAELSGTSEGVLFTRYGSKSHLLRTALQRQNEAGWQLNEDYVSGLAEEHGRGIANAVVTRETLAPHRRAARSRTLELHRLAWHDPEALAAASGEMDRLRESLLERPGWAAYETEAEFHLEVLLFLGWIGLSSVVDGLGDLPLDVVSVPWDRLRSARG